MSCSKNGKSLPLLECWAHCGILVCQNGKRRRRHRFRQRIANRSECPVPGSTTKLKNKLAFSSNSIPSPRDLFRHHSLSEVEIKEKWMKRHACDHVTSIRRDVSFFQRSPSRLRVSTLRGPAARPKDLMTRLIITTASELILDGMK